LTGDNNTKGIILMMLSMVAFTLADTLVKVISPDISPPQILILLMGGSLILFVSLAKIQGEHFNGAYALSPIMLLRYAAEILAMFSMVLALVYVPLSTVGAITQASPIIGVLGAVLFLEERISWRRWVSIIIGFLGVLLIIQPGSIAFEPSVLWAVSAMFGLAIRDLTTRVVPAEIQPASMAAYTMIVATPCAVVWALYNGDPLISSNTNWYLVVPMILLGTIGYVTLISSLRMALVSVVLPFRYSRIVIMIVLGMVLFDERPNALVYIGAALVIASGIYIIWREQQVKKGNN